jgi:DNA helicase IV
MAADRPPDPFPELGDERAHLRRARACRDRMVAELERVVASREAADEITQEYVEVVAADALADLGRPGAADFFGRIDVAEDGDVARPWYVGRRHIDDADRTPVVVDWRAPVAAPFYRATVHDPLGVRRRRRFTQRDGDLVAYLDEHLDDPDAADVAGGIPDPVLAEIGAARTGAMREIVATIQAEQDTIIRRPLEGCVVVQGGPGTGKTAVGLHRAAYLLFEHRRRLAREGVLVVGPNRVFLEYVADVLPSLGERSVTQRTLLELATPTVPVSAEDDEDVARLKGDARLAAVLARAAAAAVRPPEDDLRIPVGARVVRIPADEVAGWFASALASPRPLNRRRAGFRALAAQELARRTGVADAWGRAGAARTVLDRAWPIVRPIALVERVLRRPEVLGDAAEGILAGPEIARLAAAGRGRRRPWTPADQLLVDEAAAQLDGVAATFGHVVVDEAQDLSAIGLRAVGRRAPSGSLTLLGDLAQTSTPAGQDDWAVALGHLGVAGAVEHLTIGYRVPAPILELAARVLPLTGAAVVAPRSVRAEGSPPAVVRRERLGDAVVAAVADLRRRHPLTGVVAPAARLEELAAALSGAGLTPADRLGGLAPDEVPLFAAERAKGLELDGVVVAAPGELLDGTRRGARLLYVALTRAVQEAALAVTGPLPPVLAADGVGDTVGHAPWR